MNFFKVRWKHKTEQFKYLEDAKKWASTRDRAQVYEWNTVKWIRIGEPTRLSGPLHKEDEALGLIKGLLLGRDKLSAKEIAEFLGYNISRVRYLLIDLLNLGAIQRERISVSHSYGGKWSYTYTLVRADSLQPSPEPLEASPLTKVRSRADQLLGRLNAAQVSL